MHEVKYMESSAEIRERILSYIRNRNRTSYLHLSNLLDAYEDAIEREVIAKLESEKFND